MDNTIVPVLLGADLNCYSIARAFHEAYGVRSYAFGKKPLGETSHSKIIKFIQKKNLSSPAVMRQALLDFAKSKKDKELYLIPCTDEYVLAVAQEAEELKKYYRLSCPDIRLAKDLSSKDFFYMLCRKHGLPFPETVTFSADSRFSVLESLPFPYPIIVKPSSSAEYWRAPFEGMKKVYTAENADEAKAIISSFFDAGYKNSVILQEKIPAREDDVFVMTAYSDKDSRVRAACMGHVLLGEHTPKGLGNHVAIITEYHEEITRRLCKFLETIGYQGFANFDILWDSRSGEFKILELNTRQGRSNYYMTAAGMNLAELIVNDRNEKLHSNIQICRENIFWHTVPKSIIYNYITDRSLLKKARMLVKSGKESTSLFYDKDLFMNPFRTAYVLIHNVRYFGKYKKYR